MAVEDDGASNTFKEKMSSVLDAIDAAYPSLKPADGDCEDSIRQHLTNPTQCRYMEGSPKKKGQVKSPTSSLGRQRGRGYCNSKPSKPDFVTNPSKWKKYNLSDDGTKGLKKSGMSAEQVNRLAAFQFLEEIKKQKQGSHSDGGGGNGDESEVGKEEGKVIFKKPTKKTSRERQRSPPSTASGNMMEVTTGGVGGSVVMMPEYVVGGKEGRERKRKRRQLQVLGRTSPLEEDSFDVHIEETVQKSVCLSHLEEEDRDNE